MADQYLIYLRKSRQDRDAELQSGNFDTLARHRCALLALAKQRQLHVVGILEEVVTGDTIAERPKMRELLSMVETGAYAGVLVMEVARLARGKTRDQGIVSETFQYSATKIITPDKIYSPGDDADTDFFEFGLFMSRQEYRMINKRLNRGRMASLNEGKYIAGAAPYGYEKYKLPQQKGYSLRIVPDTAQIVRRIYHLYTVGAPDADGVLTPMGSFRIANQLNAESLPSPGGKQWTATAVRDILRNPAYIGMIRWSYRPVVKKVQNGDVVISCPVNTDPKLVQGVHEPIISAQQWDAAQKIRERNVHSTVPGNKKAVNPLAGVLYCAVCGRSMVQTLCGQGGKTQRLMCPTTGCPTVSHRTDEVEAELMTALGRWLAQYRLQCDRDALLTTSDAGQQEAAVVSRIQRAVAGLHEQQARLFDLLEQGVYSPEIFVERSKLLAEKLTAAESDLCVAKSAADRKSAADHARKNLIPEIEHLLNVYKSLSSAEERSALLKHTLGRVLYGKTKSAPTGEILPTLYVFPRTDSSADCI